jgi:(1->4)-alpha-D-glucan 1-alpha-D-glucosylmutase
VNSLAQTLVKLTAPGVPDTYQGTELWDLSLVDPDNRRPVDWKRLSRLLEEDPLREPKQWVTSRLLALRRAYPEAFAGGYMPVAAASDVCAFMRGPNVLVVVPLAASASPDVDVKGEWRDVLEERFPFRVYRNGTVSRSTEELG